MGGRSQSATAVDLFAGAGGLTAGLKAAGLDVLAAVELNPVACATYRLNHPEVVLLERDIRSVQADEILETTGLRRGELSLLAACAPCQGYSSLGKKRPDDPRNDLVLTVLDFVDRLHPAVVAFENVPRLVSDHRFVALEAGLRGQGYGVRSEVMDAADFQVPQRRRRLVMIAMLGVADVDVPRMSSIVSGSVGPVHVVDAWAGLPPIDSGDPLHVGRRYPEAVLARIRAVPKNGGSRRDLPPEHRLRCHEHLGNQSSNVYGRMRWDDVAPTLTTRCTSPSCGRFLHPEEDRAITLREAALLQTFAPDYRFAGGRMAIEAQIGNAVPVKLAETIGALHFSRSV